MKDGWKWRRDSETWRQCEEYFAARRAYFQRQRDVGRPTWSSGTGTRPHRGMSEAAMSLYSSLLSPLDKHHGF